jgi:uncharacterized membrane protein YdjX (TVP38/TMEM64 family)
MRRLLLLFGGIALVVIATFGLAEALGASFLDAPSSSGVACALLVADFALPVPSSLLLAYLGAVHGVWMGAALGGAAHLAGGAIGFAIGRASRGAVGRWMGEEQRRDADALLERWGILGIAATRPIPVLAEAVAIIAGTSRSTGWGRFLVAAAAGGFPYAVINAAAGSQAREGSFGLAVGVAVGIAIALWLGSRIFLHRRRKNIG